ncbi:MAG: hypothetical protein FWD47_15095, partial [Treponema sp.]|nr:hypothetical protein [Treponema sp.]
MKRKKFGFTCYLLFICTIFIMCSTNSNNITEKDISMNQITYEKQVWGSNPSDLTCSIGNVSNFYIDDKLAFEI